MLAISESVMLVGICLVVFGVGPKLSAENTRSFLNALAAALDKNLSEKDVERVDSVVVRSTYKQSMGYNGMSSERELISIRRFLKCE
jgi:hypothetical protein